MSDSSVDTLIVSEDMCTGEKSIETSLKPLITRLYDGSTELVIRIPSKRGKKAAGIPAQESIELLPPAPDKDVDENECIINLVSLLTKYLLNDFKTTKTQNTRSRQMAGISRAKNAGKQMGRPKKEFPDAYYEAIRLCQEGKISIAEAAKQSGMTYTTFYANLRRENHGEQDSKRPARWKKDLPSEYYEAVKLCKEGKLTTAEGARHAGMDYWSFYRYMKNMNHREAEIIWGKS